MDNLPKPYYQDQSAAIYHADCRDILPHLPAASVDLILTDPPYGISYRSKSKSGAFAPTIANDDSLNAMRGSLPLLDRLLKPDRHIYIFAAPTLIGEATAAITDYWKLKNLIVWDKGNAGSRGDLTAGYAMNWEVIIYSAKGRRSIFGPRPRCIFRYDWQSSRDPVHPTAKPVAMMEWLLSKSTAPGELIVDPFCGSGVTLKAASILGRRSIGIEIDERHCETSANRLVKRQKAA